MKKYFKPSDDINNASNFVSNEEKLVGDHKDKDKRSNDINDLFEDLDDEFFSNLPDPLSVKMIDPHQVKPMYLKSLDTMEI